jgi:hypothetical protein
VVSLVLLVRSAEEVRGSTPVESIKFYTTQESQPEGATWQPMTGPRGTSPTNQKLPLVKHRMVHVSAMYPTTCLLRCLPNQQPYCHITALSTCHCIYHVSLLTSSCATCHPYSGDMCHPWAGPVACHTPHHLPCVFSRSCHVSCTVVQPI